MSNNPRRPTAGESRDEQETPDLLFAKLCKEFRFKRDVCASRKNAKLPVFWSKRDNALKKNWGNTGAVWMNPPYSNPAPWVEKAYQESKGGLTVVALLPLAGETGYFQDWIIDKADEVRFLSRRLKFKGYKWSSPLPNVVVVFRRHDGPTRYTKMKISIPESGQREPMEDKRKKELNRAAEPMHKHYSREVGIRTRRKKKCPAKQ